MTLGRDFLPAETKPGADHVVILTNRLWSERYHRDPNILGKQIQIEGQAYTVVGVRSPGPPDRGDGGRFSVPVALTPANGYRYWGNIFGRLKPGITLEQAQAELSVIAKRLAATRPADFPKTGWSVSVEHLKNDWLNKSLERNLWLLMAAVSFVLLIACVNVANLLLAKGTARQKEIAVRASVGATRGEIFTQLVTESLTLAVLGGLIGIGLGWALIRVLPRLLPGRTLPSEAVVQLNMPVLLFAIAATLVTGLLFGCVPAMRASRIDLSEQLKQTSRSLMGSSRLLTQKTLVAAEFALALTLLAGAGLALHSFWNLTRIDLGFQTDHVLIAGLRPPEKQPPGTDATIASARALLEKVAAIPGVEKTALTTSIPLMGFSLVPFSIAGQPISKNPPQADLDSRPPNILMCFASAPSADACSPKRIAPTARPSLLSTNHSHTVTLAVGIPSARGY